jgi:uncharacterized protein YkwD
VPQPARTAPAVAFACALVALLAPAAAQARPEISVLELSGDPFAGQAVQVVVQARDAAAPINGVELDYGDATGPLGLSACRRASRGQPRPSGVFARGIPVRFSIPHEYAEPGARIVRATVESGGCDGTPRTETRTLSIAITLPGLPGSGPAPGIAPLPVAIPAIPVPPLARAAQADCANADIEPTPENEVVIRRAVQCLVNLERNARGLRRLRANRRLRLAASGHTSAMIERRFFGHQQPGGVGVRDRLRAVRYITPRYRWTVGENLAYGIGRTARPREILALWMASPGHRANILEARFREVGVGIMPAAPGATGGATYTTDFGVRR